ncbi:MAG TPA: sugar ABC transporter substrate-binding protein [bacterium]|nr:sugar ABC transporter substrate-binding protein [bacterium]
MQTPSWSSAPTSRRRLLRAAAAGLAWPALRGAAAFLDPMAASAAAPITLQYPSWMFSEPATGKYFRDLSAAYNQAHPNFRVDLVQLPAGQYVEKIFTEIQSGQVPDVLPLFTTQMPQYMHLGLLEPLDPWLDRAPFKNKLVLLQKFAQRDGKNYGVPLTASPQGLLYNQLLLEKAKVDIPKTLDDLYSAADKIYKATGVFGFGVHTDTSTMLLAYVSCMQWVLGNGGEFSRTDGAITCNAPKTVEGFQQMMRFVNAPFAPKGLGWYQLRTMFAEGKLAMLFDGPWDLGQVKAVNPKLYPHIGMTPCPTPTHAAITGGAFYTILKKEANKQAVWDYIALGTSDEWQQRWIEVEVQVPGTTLAPTPAFLRTNPGYRFVTEMAAKYATGFGYLPPGYERVATTLQTKVIDHVGDIWSGAKPPKTAMDECQKELEAWSKTLPPGERS